MVVFLEFVSADFVIDFEEIVGHRWLCVCSCFVLWFSSFLFSFVCVFVCFLLITGSIFDQVLYTPS